jgi:hypothetical protein
LNAFAAVAVGIVGQQDETCNNIPQQSIISNMASNTSSPSKMKSNKNTSLCLTGTPSSQQRPSKTTRPNGSTPVNTKSDNTSSIQLQSILDNGAAIINEDNEVSILPPLPPNLRTSTDGEPLFAKVQDDTQPNARLSGGGSGPLSTPQAFFVTSLTESMKNRFGPNFKYKSAFVIKNGPAAGYKADFSEEESICVKERIKGGTLWIDLVKRFENRDSQTRGFHGTKMCGVEELIRYKCKTACCKCELIVARAAGGIIAYEKVDLTTNEAYVHTGHDLPPDEQKKHRNKHGGSETGSKSKYDGYSLTPEQKEYINQQCAVLMHKGDYHAIIRSMIISPSVNVLTTQLTDRDMFSKRIRYYVEYLKKMGHASLADRAMTGNDIQRILDHLKWAQNTTSSCTNDIPFLQSTDFECVQNRIRISDHDYHGSGGEFSFICFEFIDAQLRAKRAVERFGDAGVQGEMDFFHVPGVDADWQVGHIGFSDHNHRYHILCMIICHSENSTNAGLLVQRAVELITTIEGGKLTCILVDGGTALNKAIGDDNAQNQLLRGWMIRKRRCFAHIIRMVSHGRTNC